MKGGMKLHQLQQKRKDEEDEWKLTCQACAICNKTLSGPYGRFMEGDRELWVCSAKCEGERNDAVTSRANQTATN